MKFLLPFLSVAFAITASAQAQNLILNGDFETVNLGTEPFATFPGWLERTGAPLSVAKNSVAIAETAGAISGTTSAELVAGTAGGEFAQSILGSPIKFTIDFDFAILAPATGNTSRTFQVLVLHDLGTGTNQINLITTSTGLLQVFSGTSSFVNLPSSSLTAAFTTDTGTAGVFDGEIPVVNHITIAGDYDTTDGTATPRYSVTLSGGTSNGTVSDVTLFQTSATVVSPANNGIDEISFRSTSTAKNFLVDNVSVVPEPGTGAAGLASLLVIAMRRHRRVNHHTR